jgi:tripartite-type tricarboxylate transporter receptor subunit TctC
MIVPFAAGGGTDVLARAVGQPNAAELYLQAGDDMVISFEGLMSLRTRIVAPG